MYANLTLAFASLKPYLPFLMKHTKCVLEAQKFLEGAFYATISKYSTGERLLLELSGLVLYLNFDAAFWPGSTS